MLIYNKRVSQKVILLLFNISIGVEELNFEIKQRQIAHFNAKILNYS